MKHFFINFLLSIFFILPNWILKALTMKKEVSYKNEVFDYQSMTYISLISWYMTKFGQVLDMADFSDDMRKKMSDIRMKINNNKSPKQVINKKDHIIEKKSELVLRQYSIDSEMTDKAVLFFHGGGYAISNIDVYNPVVSLMCQELNSNIFSLEYSLSPENKFPKALEEANIAFDWLKSKGFKKENIIICGDSAGAHLAASLLHDLNSKNKELPFLQVLIYPMISPSLDFPSMERLRENFLLTKEQMKWFWHYFRADESNNLDPRFDLLKIDNNDKFNTKTVIITAGFDPLCDEAEAYAAKLNDIGNDVKQIHYPSLFHGFINITRLKTAKLATMDIFREIRTNL